MFPPHRSFLRERKQWPDVGASEQSWPSQAIGRIAAWWPNCAALRPQKKALSRAEHGAREPGQRAYAGAAFSLNPSLLVNVRPRPCELVSVVWPALGISRKAGRSHRRRRRPRSPRPGRGLDGRCAKRPVDPPRSATAKYTPARRAVGAGSSAAGRVAPRLEERDPCATCRNRSLLNRHIRSSAPAASPACRAQQPPRGARAVSGHGGSTITRQTAKLLCSASNTTPASGMTEAEYEARLPAHHHREEGAGSALRDGDGAAVFQGRDPHDLPQPGLSRGGLAGLRGPPRSATSQVRQPGRCRRGRHARGLLVPPSRLRPHCPNSPALAEPRPNLIIGLMEEQGLPHRRRGRRGPREPPPAEPGPRGPGRRLLCRLGDGFQGPSRS